MTIVVKVKEYEIKDFKNGKRGILLKDGSKKGILAFLPDDFDIVDGIPSYDIYAVLEFYSVHNKVSNKWVDTFQFRRFYNSGSIDLCNLFGSVAVE